VVVQYYTVDPPFIVVSFFHRNNPAFDVRLSQDDTVAAGRTGTVANLRHDQPSCCRLPVEVTAVRPSRQRHTLPRATRGGGERSSLISR